MALQIVMDSGSKDEQIFDLKDAPELVLFNFCDMTLRHQDMRNPDAQRIVREMSGALREKAETESASEGFYNRDSIKEYVAHVDDVLAQFTSA